MNNKVTDKKKGAQPYGKIGYTTATETNSKTVPIMIGVGVAVVAVLIVVAVLLTQGGDDDVSTSSTGAAAAKNATQETAAVTVSGEDLPTFPGAEQGQFVASADADEAVGLEIPGLEGESFDGSKVSILPDDGKPKVILFIAHWCPHCQAEVPLIQDYLAQGQAPEGVDFYAVSTAVDKTKPNYPPSSWLSKVDWQPPTMLDDASNTAAAAYGLTSYPYFVLVGADGKVVARGSGEIPIEQFDALVQPLAPGGSATATTAVASSAPAS